MSVALCVVKHFGPKSPINAYKSEIKTDAEALIAGGMDPAAAWIEVAEGRLADLTAERTRIAQDVADAYAKTPAGKRAAEKAAEPPKPKVFKTRAGADAAKSGGGQGAEEGLTLEAPALSDLQAEADRADEAEAADKREQARLKREADKERERKELGDRTRQDASADGFELGQSRAEVVAAMAGNGDLSAEPATQAAAESTTPSAAEKAAPANSDSGARFSRTKAERRAADFDQTKTEPFKRWSNDAPLITSADAPKHTFVNGEKIVVEAYHGTKRPDRIGTKFLKKRATSGPMAYHTSDPTLASSYAAGKADTSLSMEDQDYSNWFKVKMPGDRSATDLVRSWYRLDAATKDRIVALAPRVTYSDEQEADGGNKIVLGDESVNSGTGSYDYNLAQTRTSWDRRGNPLKAMVEDWLSSGNLFNDEERFMQVLKLAGFPMSTVEYDSPQSEYPFVYKNYIAMRQPLVTNDLPGDVILALQEAAKRDRSKAAVAGADMWDKNTRTLREWVKELTEPSNGSASYVWTSIPDKVTEVFKSLGYDGIVDYSGKGGGPAAIHAPVYIPFEETQVKSAIGNKGTFNADKKDILFSRARGIGISTRDAEALVAGIRQALPNAPDIILLESVDKAPEDLREAIQQEGAEDDVEAVYHQGRIYAFPANMASVERAAFVIAHHEVRHHGMRTMYGKRLDAMLMEMHRTNPALQEATQAIKDAGRAGSKETVKAVEEALADMPVADLKKLNGWDRFVATVRTLLRVVAFRLRKAGMPNAADAINPKEWTDRDVAAFVLRAEQVSGAGSGGVAFSRDKTRAMPAKNDQQAPDSGGATFSRASGPARTPTGYTLREFGMAGKTVEALQDRYSRWKTTIDDVQAQGGVLTEVNDFYRAEERYWGKVASRIEDFEGEMKGFTKALAKDKLTLAAVQDYAYAKHAQERNDYLRTKRDPNGTTGFDSWSGMTDDDAQAIIDQARLSGTEADLEKHRQTLQGWIKGTRDLMLAEGLITPEQHQTLSTFYKDYVPLRGNPKGDKAKGNGTGSGFNIRGAETKKAKGRYSEADNIIEHIVQDRVRALTRAGKNEVLRSFLQFVSDNPDPTLWEINAVEKKAIFTIDDQGNQIIEEQPAVVKDDRTVGIKDGGREVFVLIKDVPLREQMKNLNVEQLGATLGYMLVAQRMLGRLYTSLNPVFTVLNWSRDVQAAVMSMIDSVGFNGAGKFVLNVPAAMRESYRAEFGSAAQPGRALRNALTPREMSSDYQLFRATGGKTGFMNFKNIEQQAVALSKSLKNAERSRLNPMRFGPAALDLIEGLNAVIENSTRFAVWQAARSEGKTLAQASSISKNLVNFNRKGTMTNHLGAWFLFFNPAVQGSVRVAQALKSPKVLATVGAGMTGVALLALQNADMGEDDDGVSWWDKVPPEVKDRNLIIILPPTSKAGEAIPGSKDGRYIKIPMPYGWNWFATVANQAVDMHRNGKDPARGATPTQAMKRVVSSFLGAYMPVQELARSAENSTALVLAAVPDFLNAPAQSFVNMNSFGRTMYPESESNKNLPDSTKYFAGQSGTIFQRGAETLNKVSGGSKYDPGLLDFTPATLENLARSYGGGPASFTLDIMNAMYVRQNIERPDLDVRRIPFVKQLYGRIDAETDRMLGYERMDKIDVVVDRVKAAQRPGGDMAEARRLAAENPELYRLGGKLVAVREQLSVLRKQELDIIASKESEGSKYAKLQIVAERKRKALQNLNAAYNDATRQERARTATPAP